MTVAVQVLMANAVGRGERQLNYVPRRCRHWRHQVARNDQFLIHTFTIAGNVRVSWGTIDEADSVPKLRYQPIGILINGCS